MIKKLLKNDVVKQFRDFGIGPIIGMFISMLTVPVTTRLVLPEEFGKSSLFTLVQTIFLIAALFGLDQAFVRYYNSKEFSKEAVLYNSFTLPLLLTIILGLVSFVFMKPISIWLYGSYEKELMLLFPPFLLALLFNRYAYLILRMELRGKLYSLLNIISQIVSFALLLTLLLFFEKTFRSIILATIFSTIINTIIVFIITKESWKINKKYFEKELTKKMLFFAFPLVPATLISWLLNSFDKVALKVWSTYEELGLYAAAFKIVSLLTIFQNIFTTSWIPIAYKWYEEKKPNELYEKISSLTSFIMTFIFACVVFFRNVIVILLGESYRNTTEIFIFLLFVPVMYTISEASTVGINLKKKTSYVLYATLIATLSNLFLNYLLVPKYGAIGAAIGTCISYVMFFFARVFFARRVWYKFPVANLLMNTSYMIALAVFVFFEAPKIIELALLVIIVITNFCYNRKNNIKFT